MELEDTVHHCISKMQCAEFESLKNLNVCVTLK